MDCNNSSKKYCMACEHYGYCDIANRCNGVCHKCDDCDYENNPKYRADGVFEMKKKLEMQELYTLCNREQLFTSGSIEQYRKMFEIAASGITQMELAYILYVCSSYRLDIVYNMIQPLFMEDK